MMNSFERISERNSARPELMDRRQDLEDFLESGVVGLYVIDADGTALRANKALLDLLGCGREEFVGRKLAEFHADAAIFEDMLARLGRGEKLDRYGARLKARDGTIRHVDITASAQFRDGRFIGARCFTVDVTERVRADEALHRVEQRCRALLDALPVPIYTTDAAGRITFYNRVAAEFAGRKPRIGVDEWCVTWRLLRPDGTPLPHEECPMATALKEERPVRGIEAVAERPDGTRVPFLPYPTPLRDASGAMVGAVNMLVDITQHKKAEQELQRLNETLEQRVWERTRQAAETSAKLRDSERCFRLLVNGVVDYSLIMLDPDGIVINWNAGAERMKGYAADEIIGQHFSRFYTEPDRRRGMPQRALATATKSGKCEAEGWRLRKDGTPFWASVLIDAIRDETGELVGFAKLTRDLTEKRKADEQLRQAQKMEAIGQLTGGVAHDFNNLLTAIIGNLEVLETVLSKEERAQRYVESASRAAWRGARLAEQLLAFSRRQEVHPELVDINSLLRDTALLCRKTIGERIEFVLNLQEPLWTCRIDAAQLETAVLNLAGNARDAMDRSGVLTIRTENLTVGEKDDVDLAAGDYVALSVSDTGCGMSAEVAARAFEPFYTTKEVGRGTGLGLSQVYGFAKQSGGMARIKSRIGVGTTVQIFLPRVDGTLAAQEAAEVRLAQAAEKNATILLVEDDPQVREAMIDVLSQLGYRFVIATNGLEAMALLRRDSKIDLLFTDIVMPGGMDGIDLARTARELRPDLKILLSSGFAGSAAKVAALRAEFPFIAKPYRTSMLARKLLEVLADGVGATIS